MNNTLKLIISIAVPLAIGALGSYFTIPGVQSWYQTINRPSWNPPNSIFAPVWTTLYVLMGIAFYLVWKSGDNNGPKSTAISLFAVQLVLNSLWSIIFFHQQQVGWALAEMILLWIFILLTIFSFAKINKLAAWLLVPYLSWVSFALFLNYTIWQLNK